MKAVCVSIGLLIVFSSVATGRLIGDADNDGSVNLADLSVLAVNWEISVSGGFDDADFNEDGIVDLEDLSLLASNWGAQTSQIDYYVDATDGNDANTGLSPSAAWKTVAKVNSMTFNAGERVLFQRGEIWREKLTVSSSGTLAEPITFGAYGDVGEPKPTLDGLIELAPANGFTWSLYYSSGSVKVWQAISAFEPSGCYWSGVLEIPGEGQMKAVSRSGHVAPAVMAPQLNDRDYFRSWYIGGMHRYFVRLDAGSPGDGSGRKFFLAKDFATLIDTNEKSHIVIDNLTVKGADATYTHPGILLRNADDITVQNCEILFSMVAIANYYPSIPQGAIARNCQILNNDIHENTECGIYFRHDASNIVISGNDIHHNYQAGKRSAGGDRLAIAFQGNSAAGVRDNRVEYNSIHHNGEFGVDLDNAIAMYYTTDTQVRYNHIYDNEQGVYYASYYARNVDFSYNMIHGNSVRNRKFIFCGSSAYATVYNNMIYGNTVDATEIATSGVNSYCLFSLDGPYEHKVKNNIFANNTLISSTDYPVRVFTDRGGSTANVDYNLYYNNTSTGGLPANAGLYQVGYTTFYANFSAWQTAGYDSHGMEADPAFTNAAGADFTLQASSPAINAGVDVGLTKDYAGNPIVGSPDIGAHERQP